MKKYSQSIGWCGTILVLLAYALLSFGILLPHSFWYQLLNLIGAIGIVIDTYYKKDYPPEILNIIWMCIALITLISSFIIK